MKRGRALALGALVLAACAAAGAWFAWRWLPPRLAEWRMQRFIDEPQGAPGASPIVVAIGHGTGALEIVNRLEAAGVVGPAQRVLIAAGRLGLDRSLQPGVYSFRRPVSPRSALELLAGTNGGVEAVTVPEGLLLDEIAAVFADAGVAPLADLRAAFRDPAPLRALDPRARDLEGYLLPGTYRVSRGVPAPAIAAALVGAFEDRFARPEGERIARSGRTLREIVTLASLVEEETAIPAERGRIAGVFAERLARGMRLQCDPTVIYAARRAGTWDGDIRRRDLARRDPYNTYVHAGLPPGPISSPGLAALRAALDPERDGSLYFAARGDGSHVFSKTLAAHNRVVRAYLMSR